MLSASGNAATYSLRISPDIQTRKTSDFWSISGVSDLPHHANLFSPNERNGAGEVSQREIASVIPRQDRFGNRGREDRVSQDALCICRANTRFLRELNYSADFTGDDLLIPVPSICDGLYQRGIWSSLGRRVLRYH